MKYVYGQYIDEPVMMVNSSGTYYYHQNNLYSVAALTAASDGSLKECYAYTPYGEPTVFSYSGGTLTDITATPSSWLGNPFLFTGRRYDTETGLQYSRARYYSSALGRFLSRDPIGYKGGVNLYEYVNDMPVGYIDPFGLEPTATPGQTDQAVADCKVPCAGHPSEACATRKTLSIRPMPMQWAKRMIRIMATESQFVATGWMGKENSSLRGGYIMPCAIASGAD